MSDRVFRSLRGVVLSLCLLVLGVSQLAERAAAHSLLVPVSLGILQQGAGAEPRVDPEGPSGFELSFRDGLRDFTLQGYPVIHQADGTRRSYTETFVYLREIGLEHGEMARFLSLDISYENLANAFRGAAIRKLMRSGISEDAAEAVYAIRAAQAGDEAFLDLAIRKLASREEPTAMLDEALVQLREVGTQNIAPRFSDLMITIEGQMVRQRRISPLVTTELKIQLTASGRMAVWDELRQVVRRGVEDISRDLEASGR